jgi:hypothetical protein
MKLKKLLALLVVCALAASFMVLPTYASSDISVKLVARTFESDTSTPVASSSNLRLTGDGSYEIEITSFVPGVSSFSNLNLVDSRYVYNAHMDATTVPPDLGPEFADAIITFTDVYINGTRFSPTRAARDVPIIDLEDTNNAGKFNRPLWNAWHAPAHLISGINTTQIWGAPFIDAGAPLTSILVKFNISGLGEGSSDSGTTTPPTPPAPAEFDGTYKTSDALTILRIAAGIIESTPEFLEIYDLDKDGKITTADALIVLRIAAGLMEVPGDCDDDCDDGVVDPKAPIVIDFAAAHPVIGESGNLLRTAGIGPADVELTSQGFLAVSNRTANWQGIDLNFAPLAPGTYTVRAVVTSATSAHHQVDVAEGPWTPKAATGDGTRVTHTFSITVLANGTADTPAGNRERVRFNTNETGNFTIESITITPA